MTNYLKKPKTRSQCAQVPRPCPYVSCRYHMWVDVADETGVHTRQDCEPWEMDPCNSCALDIAEREGPATVAARAMGLTTAQFVQEVASGICKMRARLDVMKEDLEK